MDFKRLNVDELKDLAEFYVIDVTAVNEEKPTKKELLTAIATAEDPITDEDYEAFKADREKPVENVDLDEDSVDAQDGPAEPAVEVDRSNWVLVKFIGKNPRLDVLGYTFLGRHPFQSVPPEVAEHLILHREGFRLALPSELTDYYN
jgi:hypothetical protein